MSGKKTLGDEKICATGEESKKRMWRAELVAFFTPQHTGQPLFRLKAFKSVSPCLLTPSQLPQGDNYRLEPLD